MTGYVRTFLPELKILEEKYYKAAYCGLCVSMGKNVGRRAKMLLSYDFTLLALVRLAVLGIRPEFVKKRCSVHPFKKRFIIKDNAALSHSAISSVLLAHGKISDDIADETGMKSLRAKIARLYFKKSYRKAQAAYPELDKMIKEKLLALSEIEKSALPSVDTPANIFAEILGEIFAHGDGVDGVQRKILYEIGFSVGRWIYTVDALDDMEEDKRDGKYNSFLLLFDGKPLDDEKKEDLYAALTKITTRAANALDLVDFEGRRDLRGLIENIIFEGMPRRAYSILYGEGENEKQLEGYESSRDV